MLDGITVDQVRTFLAAVDEGSFSAAGRKLARAQSVVSQTMAAMEHRLGVVLFDRTGRFPVLTQAGRSLVPDARGVLQAMAVFKGHAAQMSAGLEPEVGITVDVMLPLDIVTRASIAFEAAFPATALRLSVEALGAVIQRLIDGRDAFAVAGPLASKHPMLAREHFPGVAMVAVASPGHVAAKRSVALLELAEHRQLILSDRSELSKDREFGVVSARNWRMSDLGAKRALLKAGLGWGAMPRAMIAEDLDNGSLVVLRITNLEPAWMTMPMHIVYPTERPPGVAARWMMNRLREEADDYVS
ncbi:LysR family transcriptional regulator [Agrobacterium cavarae]|uniref:LysR family transcriptional regulator n=1 Tax=Agrobacterium cavarae TaxID=2528239 RepID=UPI003FD60072